MPHSNSLIHALNLEDNTERLRYEKVILATDVDKEKTIYCNNETERDNAVKELSGAGILPESGTGVANTSNADISLMLTV